MPRPLALLANVSMCCNRTQYVLELDFLQSLHMSHSNLYKYGTSLSHIRDMEGIRVFWEVKKDGWKNLFALNIRYRFTFVAHSSPSCLNQMPAIGPRHIVQTSLLQVIVELRRIVDTKHFGFFCVYGLNTTINTSNTPLVSFFIATPSIAKKNMKNLVLYESLQKDCSTLVITDTSQNALNKY